MRAGVRGAPIMGAMAADIYFDSAAAVGDGRVTADTAILSLLLSLTPRPIRPVPYTAYSGVLGR